MLLITFCCIILVSAIVPSKAAEICEPIRVCDDATYSSTDWSENVSIPLGSTVAERGHIMGILPHEYDLDLTFENATHFSGSVNISMLIVENTAQVLVSLSPNLQYEMKEILIYRNCSEDNRRNVCIKVMIQVFNLRVLQLILQSDLLSNATYILSFPEFSSFAYQEKTQQGAKGLRRIVDKSHSLVYTDFRMNEASTVYPCFDYPSLKAVFELCFQHPDDMSVVINHMSNNVSDYVSEQSAFCYNPSLPFATFVFGFALMTNYDNITQVPDDTCQLIADIEVKKTVLIMERITNTSCPFPNLSVVVWRFPQNVGTDNAGFVMVDCDTLLGSAKTSIARRHIYRSIIKQWMNVLATIDHFGLACLTNSLIEYLVWLIEEELHGINLAINVDEARRDLPGYYESLTATDYYFGDDASTACLTVGPLVFHMLRQHNASMFENFLRELVTSGGFGTMSMQDWNQALIFSGSDEIPISEDFFSRWFGMTGPALIFVRNNGYDVSIKRLTHDQKSIDTKGNFIVAPIFTSILNHTEHLFLTKNLLSFSTHVRQAYFLIDADDITPTYKVYDSNVYLYLFRNFYSGKGDHLELLDPRKLLRGFCDALYKDYLPQEGDVDVNRWKNVFKFAYNMSPDCRCCLRPVAERSDCTVGQNQACRMLRLVNMLGYNS